MKITCKQAVNYISKKEEGKLSAVQRFALWRHLAVCSLCRRFSDQNKVIGKAMREMNNSSVILTQEEKDTMAKNILDKK
jgi:hypothetical protein